MALARVRSSQGPGAHAFFRAAPTDRERVIPPTELVYATRRALGIEEYLAPGCPRCHRGRDGGTITTMHARTCPRDGAQINMHEPLKYALSRALSGLRVKHDVESGAPFTGDQNLSMDGHRGQDRGSLQRIVSRISQQRHTPRRHSRRPASTGTLAERQRNQRWMRSPNFRGAKALALRSPRTRVL